MFEAIALPLLMPFGFLTLFSLLLTSYISLSNKSGNGKIPMKWHPLMAKITVALAIVHMVLAILTFY
jgi:hypothetical protein